MCSILVQSSEVQNGRQDPEVKDQNGMTVYGIRVGMSCHIETEPFYISGLHTLHLF